MIDTVVGWFPHRRREWIELIVVALLLLLLMIVAITELELVAVPDHWRLNLANLALDASDAVDDGGRYLILRW